jgi:hypothetical protein
MEIDLSAVRGLRNALLFSISIWALMLATLEFWPRP